MAPVSGDGSSRRDAMQKKLATLIQVAPDTNGTLDIQTTFWSTSFLTIAASVTSTKWNGVIANQVLIGLDLIELYKFKNNAVLVNEHVSNIE